MLENALWNTSERVSSLNYCSGLNFGRPVPSSLGIKGVDVVARFKEEACLLG